MSARCEGGKSKLFTIKSLDGIPRNICCITSHLTGRFPVWAGHKLFNIWLLFRRYLFYASQACVQNKMLLKAVKVIVYLNIQKPVNRKFWFSTTSYCMREKVVQHSLPRCSRRYRVYASSTSTRPVGKKWELGATGEYVGMFCDSTLEEFLQGFNIRMMCMSFCLIQTWRWKRWKVEAPEH